MSFLRDLFGIPANLKRIADASERIARATEAMQKKYAPPQPPDPRYK
jgi:hypothetical protein